MDEDLPPLVGLHDIEEHLDVSELRALPLDRDVDVGQAVLGDEEALLTIPALVCDREVHDHFVPLLGEERDLVVPDLPGRREHFVYDLEVANSLERLRSGLRCHGGGEDRQDHQGRCNTWKVHSLDSPGRIHLFR